MPNFEKSKVNFYKRAKLKNGRFDWWSTSLAISPFCLIWNLQIQVLYHEERNGSADLIIGFIHHLSTPLRRYFFSLLSCSAARLREYIKRCMCRTAILKNNSTAEKRREEETFALASIAHYCFVETILNCEFGFPFKPRNL